MMFNTKQELEDYVRAENPDLASISEGDEPIPFMIFFTENKVLAGYKNETGSWLLLQETE